MISPQSTMDNKQQSNGTSHPLRVFVFDNMRVRSHIFGRLFSEHPDLEQIYHPFLMPSFLGPERMQRHFKHSAVRRKEIEEGWAPLYVPDTYGMCQRELANRVAEIEKKGKIVWANEHCAISMRQDICLAHYRGHKYTVDDIGYNPTYFPDYLFESCTPVIVIRHPASSVVSLYNIVESQQTQRPGDEDFYICSSLWYCRILYDLFVSQGRKPIVVDGDDVLWRTEEMTRNVCNALGIDPKGVTETWQPTPDSEKPKHPIIAGFTETIHNSTGVERPAKKPTEPVTIDGELKKAADRWGESVADSLRPHIEDYMADYEYLRQFKV